MKRGLRLGRKPLQMAAVAALLGVALDQSGTATSSLSQAASLPAFQSARQPLWIGGRAAPTRGWVEFCAKLPQECAVDPAEPASLTLTLEAWETIVAVNERVNATIKAMTDRDHWGVQDRWDFPDDGIGDCEDIQLLKRRLLVEAGLPHRALRMSVVFDDVGEGHAVLMVLTDRGEFILDNKRDAVLPWNETRYTYIKREGSDGPAWVSLVGRLAPVSGDVSASLREKALSSAPTTSSSRPAAERS
jgi:predicted transglutaminase-like cysteine proteinase